MDLLERGQKCTGWFDHLGKCDWGDVCKLHDERYMTLAGQNMERIDADLELFCGVYKKCAFMAVIMFAGVRLFGGRFWEKYKEKREVTV